MSPLHILLAILIAALWGSNFVVIKLVFQDIPPFLFLTLRFILSAFPAIFFVKRPAVSLSYLLSLSACLWIGQFALLFLGVYLGLSPGLASLIMQLQVLFTFMLSALIYQFRPTFMQVSGLTSAITGISIIALRDAQACPLYPLLMLLGAAFMVSIANILLKKTKETNTLSIIAWSSLIPPIPLFLLSLGFEGWDAIVFSIMHLSFLNLAAVGYTALASTLLAASLWGFLIRQYHPATVTPFALLIPVFGMSLSVLILNEAYPVVVWGASSLVLVGLVLHLRFQPPLAERQPLIAASGE